MSTFMANKANIERKWYILDTAGKPLGKTAVRAADLLRGKPDAAGLLRRFTHIVQQQVQTLIEFRHRVADLLQARVTFFSDLTNGHSSSSYCIALQSAKMSRPRFSFLA